jgi:chromosome segregation ATPase
MSNECQEITQAIQKLSAKIDLYQRIVEGRINKLENEVSSIKSLIDGLNTKISSVASEVNIIKIKINNHETRIIRLERYGGGGNNPNADFRLVVQRINIMSRQLVAIERYINALDEAGKNINNLLKGIFKIFKIFK